jgi:sugar O-acyltransferase (sialic acid O-acetyltransferase NeuD family)
MLIAGAGGHARELLFEWQQTSQESVSFFDDTKNAKDFLYDQFNIIHSTNAAADLFKTDKRFILGIGKPALRAALCEKLEKAGGELTSLISRSALTGTRGIKLGEGLNIMSGAVLTADIQIGKGTLIHIHVSIHHDCHVGEFCELSPGCRLLGGVQVGSFVSIGTGAVILPGIKIGNHAIIGAGSVVTKNVGPGLRVIGNPAKPLSPKQ